jgi:hypothetical protein
MSFLANSSAFDKSELLPSSTGTCPADWRAWWRQRSIADGTDWVSLHRQLVEAWCRLRSLAEVSS